ncbi:hypothetical protein VTO42DRAFT_438 [Malbranchea cinnamomea]
MRYPIVSMSLSPIRKLFWSVSRALKFLCALIPLLLMPPSPEKLAATDLSAVEESEEEVEYLGSSVPAGDRSENPSTPAPTAE